MKKFNIGVKIAKITESALADLRLRAGADIDSRSAMAEIEETLNNAKNKLDRFPPEKIAAAQRNSPFGRLRKIISKKYNAQFVSNAWLKYWELASDFRGDLRPNSRIFFNAEFPGSGILAMNHFFVSLFGKPIQEWVASSYLPPKGSTATNTQTKSNVESSTILEDRYGIYKRNAGNWAMTTTNNGDMRDPHNIRDLGARFGAGSDPADGFDVYMHDAGIDVSDDYNRQEEKNITLHFGCALAGFAVLRRGGIFVAKQYTFFKPISWQLIAIYAALFDEFYIVKPATSRAANSEIYLVGRGFRGITMYVFDVLVKALSELVAREARGESIGGMTILPPAIADEIEPTMIDIAEKLAADQIAGISKLIDSIQSGSIQSGSTTRSATAKPNTEIRDWFRAVSPLTELPREMRIRTNTAAGDREPA